MGAGWFLGRGQPVAVVAAAMAVVPGRLGGLDEGSGESTGNVWQVTTFGSLAILVVILASVLIPDRSVEPGGVHRRRIVAAVLLSWIAVLLLSRMLWLIVPSSETGIGTMIWVESTRPPWAREIGEMVRDRMYLRSGSDGNGSTLTAIMWSVPVLALLQACSLTAWLARDSRRRAEASL